MSDYIVIDTETCGMDPEKDPIVEFAAVTSDGVLVETLCNPGKKIPPEAMGIHHITDAMVADAPMPEVAVTRAMHDLKMKGQLNQNTAFAAHNAGYDRGFLTKLNVVFTQQPWICTWKCALHVWPDAPGHGNQTLRYWLELDTTPPVTLAPHRAAYDTIITEGILRRLLKERSLEDLVRLTSTPVLLTKVTFGKHKGMLWKDVPRDYCQWIVRQADMDEDTRHTAAYYLRGGQGRLI